MENKKYKMLAVDMDGTLLDSKKRITERNLEAIKRGRENGMIFTLSTGRPRPSVTRYLDAIMPDVPAVLYNGGQIYDCKTGECLYKVELASEDARQVLELADEYDVTAAVWSDEKLYTNRVDEYIGDYKSL